MERLRILSVANVPENPDAGAAGAEYQTIRALRALGHHVDALWSDSVGHSIGHGNLNHLIELPWRYERIVAGRLRAAEYDVVHVNQPHGYRAARLVQKRWPKVAFIHRSHGFEARVDEVLRRWRPRFGGDRRPLWRRSMTPLLMALISRHNGAIARWADGHLLCSTQDAEFMMQRFGVPAEKVAVVTHAAPDEYLHTAVPPLDRGRLRHVLYVGQFAFVKAPMIVAGAMNAIAAARDDVRFTWVADPRHHDAIRALLSPELREKVALPGWMPQQRLREVYDTAGIFLFPSFFEGTGKASIEALSRGLCVVASDVGGMHDMIEQERSGILVPPGDAAAVSAAALRLMSDPERAREIAANAVACARQYTWERTASATAAFYRARIEAKR